MNVRNRRKLAKRGVSKDKVFLPEAKLIDKLVTVGIDIGHNYINLVKVVKSGRKSVIAEYKSVAVPHDTEKGPDKFEVFLQAVVVPFCSGAKKTDVWVIMSAAQVEVRHVRIPRVSDNKIEKTVYWTLKKEESFNEKEYFFDYNVFGEIKGTDNTKLNIICYTAQVEEVEETKKLFSRIGVPLKGVSIIPFAVQNIFRNQEVVHPETVVACLFIGNSYSRIDLYINGKLILTRDIKTGIESMIDLLVEDLSVQDDAAQSITAEEARKYLFAHAEDAEQDIVLPGSPAPDRKSIERIIEPVLERLSRQMERTIEHFTATLGYSGKVNKVYVYGVMPVNNDMVGYFSVQLGVGCAKFDPLKDMMATASYGERASFIPAYGLALSDNAYTPNLIYSYKDKKNTADAAKANRIILVFFIVLMLVFFGVFVSQQRNASHIKKELTRLEQQLKDSSPLLNKQTVVSMMSAAREKNIKYAELIRKYKGIAVIGEVSSLTPEAVSLTGFRADLHDNKRTEKEKGKKEKGVAADQEARENTAVIEGTIGGNQDELETTLAQYVIKLNSSPIFFDVSVSSSKIGPAKQGALLTFALNFKVGRNR